MNANQPDEFLPWLAHVVSFGGPHVCTRVACRADGRLAFAMRGGETETEAVWRPGSTPQPDDIVFGANTHERLAAGARSQLLRRLTLLLEKGAPPLLERRNDEVTSISLDPELLRLTRGLLQVGETRCGPYRLAACTRDGETLRLAFRTADDEAVLRLAPTEPSAAAQFVTRCGPVALAAEVLRTDAARRAADYVGYVLHMRFGAHMTIESGTAAPMGEPADAPASFLQERYVDELAAVEVLLGCGDRVALVGACERECLQCLPRGGAATERLNRRQWVPPTSEAWRRNSRITYASEMDVVLGDGEARFHENVRHELATGRPQLLVAFSTCLSQMLGDNIERMVAAMQPETNVPMFYLDGSVAALDNHPRLWRRLLDVLPSVAPRSAEPSVNLVGFGHGRTRSLAELTDLLPAVGVAVNLAILPTFDPETLPRLGAAWANVICPSRLALGGFGPAAAGCGLPTVQPAAPCGWLGTMAWLDAVRTACGLSALPAGSVDRLAGEHAARWEELRRQAAGERIAVVLRGREVTDGNVRLNRGLPWLDALDEMGLGLDLFVLATAGQRPEIEEAAEALLPTGADGSRHRLHWLAPADDALADALRDGEFALIYSDCFRDRRVTAAGKVPFSIADFEMGFAGACRTLARLLENCRVPFYARYRQHLHQCGAAAT